MLDTETKRRIDTARDILVGKVPDPKSQVEQITIALVYKFMDDMDKESLGMGGKASFFSGEFEKYGWSRIFDPRLGGFEMLALYADAITRMGQNPNLPQLFRDIFKNAYLPYRDPETLKLFLKTINEFSYDHSERLGDAFEYLLSVLGSQGDAGQFRTPRHIIDFMVQVLKPQKNEKILDPACGTAGFLISAYKYILNDPANKKSKPGDLLSPEDKKKLLTNFKGYDISPDMVRLSLVNLYLHGFVQPQIYEYDTLTSEDRWNDYADVILANPPFMSPKGGIKPHKRFTVQSNRSEVLFVDYMAEHLTPTGRAAIIVPEGIIFQSAGAYKQLRKYLVEQGFLWAVVSLPAGVFNPYAGVKTSILLLDRTLAKKTDQILFVKIEADGFDLGAQRRPVERNDLPDTLNVLADWQNAMRNAKTADFDAQARPCSALLVAKARLAENDEYNLSADRYRDVRQYGNQKHPAVKLSDIFDIECGASPRPIDDYITNDPNGVNWIKIGDGSSESMYISETKEKITLEGAKKSRWVHKGDLILSNSMSFGHPYILKIDGCIHDGWLALRPKSESLIKEFVYHILGSEPILEQFKLLATGGVVNNLNSNLVRNVEIPLPSLEIQRQIVDKIEACQRVINGARQVVEAWKPNIEIDGDWDKAKIGDVCDFIDYRGKTPNKANSGVRLITAKNVRMGYLTDEPKEYIADYDSWMTRGIPKKGDVLFTTEGPLGNVAIIDIDDEKFAVGQRIITLQAKDGIILPIYLANVLMSKTTQAEIEKLSTGSTVKGILARYFREIEIPVPPLDVQRAIVERIESERRAVEGCRGLIAAYEGKIQKILGRVWEG